MGKRDEEAVRRFVDHLAMTLYEFGFPRMPARVLSALVADEDGALTAAQIGDRLRISPAAVSGGVRYLVQIGLVLREPVPGSRSVRYRVMSNTWYMNSVTQGGVYKRVAEVVTQGATAVGEGSKAGSRLAEMAEFFLFLQDEIAAIVEKWNATHNT